MINPDLPIKEAKRGLLYALDNHHVVILTAETGSGKTTQIPKYLIEAGYTIGSKKIAIVLPRRIAAVSIARRLSQELGVYNNQIAHQVRFNSTMTQNTRVIFMTDGMMVQQLYADPLLTQYSLIMLDDIHEKSINCQLLLAFIKKILILRQQTPSSTKLKLLLTSATLDTTRLQKYFKIKTNYKQQYLLSIKTINIPGRLYQVKINYLREQTSNYFLKIFQCIIYIDRENYHGNILVFLTSVEQIEGMINMLESYTYESKKKFNVLALHAGVALQKQTQIFQYSKERKIVLATNIAQSSITIPDIKYVIDCGYVKVKVYDIQKGIDRMVVVPCGKSSAIQRAGRAGRVFDGQCYRIYTESAYGKMAQKVVPELLRIDLSSFILKLLGLGIKDILNFSMLDKPPQEHISRAIDTLLAYELVDQQFTLTLKGKKAAQLSLDIHLASMLLNSFNSKFGCSQQILMLVPMLEIYRELFTNNSLAQLKAKKKIGAKQGDFITLINIFLKYSRSRGQQQRKKLCGELKLRYQAMENAVKIHQQLVEQIKRFRRDKTQEEKMIAKYSQEYEQHEQYKQFNNFQIKSSNDEYQAILRCIFSGYFTNIAQMQGDGTYMNIRSKQRIQLHPTSILSTVFPQWIVYHEIIKSTTYYIHNASKIQFQWILQLASHYYKDLRKEQAENKYEVEKIKKIDDFKPINVEDCQQKTSNLVQIGGKKTKPELFKTNVLGLKDMKRNKLTFQEDFDI